VAATPMISPARAKAMLDNLTANFNSQFINIYTGALEANCGTATSGTQLGAPQFGATAFPASVDGGSTGIMTATANAITSDTNADNTGTAGHFRVQSADGSGTVIAQGTCGISAADMILNTTSVTSCDTIAITSFLITFPDGSGND
jgi:hypothetical protein